MTFEEAILAMKSQSKVRIGRIKDPEHPRYLEGVVEAVCRDGSVEIELYDHSANVPAKMIKLITLDTAPSADSHETP